MSKENLRAYINVQEIIDKRVQDYLKEDNQTMRYYYKGMITGLSSARAFYENEMLEMPEELTKGDER